MIVPLNTIVCADSLVYLRSLPDAVAHCIVTSVPYFHLRDYGVDGQIGLETTPDAYIAALVDVFRAARRVLRTDGTLWINVGDTYANDTKWGGASGAKNKRTGAPSGMGPRHRVRTGLPPKSMMMIPHRLALALQADGWIVRSEIVWHKATPMPEGVKDRPSRAHEFIFLLSQSPRYYYNIDAIREPIAPATIARYRHMSDQDASTSATEKGKNKTDVWFVPASPYKEAHFATFPPKLIEPCILAGCPEHCCSACGAPYRPIVTTRHIPQPDVSAKRNAYRGKVAQGKFAGTPRLYICLLYTSPSPRD